jgi:D-alanine-D-alanine ligase
VYSKPALRAQLTGQLGRYRQPILVERFIRGREVTVGLIGNLVKPVAWRVPRDDRADRVFEGLHFLPPLEVDFQSYPESEGGVYTNRMKTDWAHDFHYLCPAPVEPVLLQELNRLTARSFATGCADVARGLPFDADDGNKPYILEVNPLPGLYPGLSDLVLEADAVGMRYDDLINAILSAGCVRAGLNSS